MRHGHELSYIFKFAVNKHRNKTTRQCLRIESLAVFEFLLILASSLQCLQLSLIISNYYWVIKDVTSLCNKQYIQE